jgi:D-alanyl-lipoteichoic acid acyltransferase DltB (MBOAT superfamily)
MIGLSYVFYGWVGWSYCLLLLATTAVAFVGGGVTAAMHRDRGRRTAMIVTVAALLGILGWFKYYGFVSVNVDNLTRDLGVGQALPLLQVALPIAISFFTFMAISYVIDIYRGKLEPAKPLDFAVYLSFFPHLLAGPIVRGTELLPQIRRRRDPNNIDYSRAFWLILAGLFKKVVISSYVSSQIVTPVFTSPSQHSGLEAIFAAWGYAVQIYCDFSGYTDIAIGLALLLGFQFPQNFNAPYTARNLQDFWRRWHMTLSRWLRDYLYIPLGGDRGGQGTTVRNIMITMVLGGLWHGAAWTFVIWGALHGVGQSFGHLRRASRERRGLPPVADGPVRVWVQRFLTFQFVCLGWVFFNASGVSQATAVIGRVFSGWGESSPLVTPLLVLVVAGTLLSQFVPPLSVSRLQAAFSRQHAAIQVGILGVALLGITTFGPVGVAPFIYYRF